MMPRFDERGAVGGLEGLAFGVLIFVFGLFMIMNTWAVIDGTMAASAAAREASRAYVESDNQVSAEVNAQSAADQLMAGYNHFTATVDITPSDSYQRCEPVTAAVTADVPRVSLPLIGGAGGVVHVHATHTEVIDPYRSGLPGQVACPQP